jgi:uncharacterized protein (DUF169 family)
MSEWTVLASELIDLLSLSAPPVAVTFADDDGGLPPLDRPLSTPTADGRSGRVAASCVFWMEGAKSGFSTRAEDHGNCSVGRWVHGFATLDEIADKTDVAALLESGWVAESDLGNVETLEETAGAIHYSPLSETEAQPDVVLLRLLPRQMMEIGDAVPGLRYSGKPQCQLVTLAKLGTPAVSMGCALSRERTGMSDSELVCAIPGGQLPGVVARLRQVLTADTAVRGYATAQAQSIG